MRYLLEGYYGMRNVGDDILLYVTIAEMAKLDPDAEFTVISDRHENLPPFANVKVISGGRLKTLRQLLHHDVWLFGGGGLLQDPGVRAVQTLRRHQRIARLAKWIKRSIVLVGIGIGPLETPEGREAARKLLGAADFVTVRDKGSADLAHELMPECNLTVTADLSFLFPKYAPAPPKGLRDGKTRTLGISLLPFSGALDKDPQIDRRVVAVIAEALNHIMKEHPEWQVRLFEIFCGSESYGDKTVLQPLRDQLLFKQRVSFRAYDGDFFSLHKDLLQCSAFYGMRLHSCVLSWLGGVPCLMTDYHMKSSAIAKSMGIRNEAILPVGDLSSSSILIERLERLIHAPEAFLPTVPISELTSSAANNFKSMRGWLRRADTRMWTNA